MLGACEFMVYHVQFRNTPNILIETVIDGINPKSYINRRTITWKFLEYDNNIGVWWIL